MLKPTFHIVGGGFSGLSLAWYLSAQKAKVILYEKSSQLGGLLHSVSTPYGLVERAAQGFLASRDVEELFSHLNLKALPTKKPYPKRYIFRGRPRAFPLKVTDWPYLAKLLGARLKGADSLRPRAEETLYDWSARQWGKDLTDEVVEPAFQGVYAAPSRSLSASLCLRPVFNPLVRGKMRGTIGVAGGMGEFVDALSVGLLKRGVEIHLQSTLREKPPPTERVLLCCGPAAASEWLQGESDGFRKQLASLPRVGLVSATIFFEPTGQELRGFGALLPRNERFHALGVLFNTDIFWERRERLRSETYIFSYDQAGALTDQEVVQRALEDRARVQNLSSTPIHYDVFRHPQALPLYGVELERFLKLHPLKRGSRVLFGNSFGALGLARILAAAKGLAQELMLEDRR